MSKPSYIGVPAIFKLNLACRVINDAYRNENDDEFGGNCYLVGSSTQKPDWRDVDVVYIMADKQFEREFPSAEIESGAFEFDAKWLLNSITLSTWLKEQTGLPVDFKIQPMSWANSKHKGKSRHPLGTIVKREKKPEYNPLIVPWYQSIFGDEKTTNNCISSGNYVVLDDNNPNKTYMRIPL